MRKQKAFRRVSAWLLVWTMVLSALAGNVTVRAEEPEEVDVQIEADTADQDQIVEPNKAPDNGNNDEDGNQDGDKNTPPTGLAVYSNINWGDDGQVLGLNDPNPDSEPWMDLYGATWCLVDSKGESVQISELTVKKVDAGSETEMTEDEYSIEKHDNVADGVENGDSYFDICFYEYGTYRIYKDMEYTQLEVGYPCLGFYSVSDNSAENLIREDVFKYAQGAEDNTFYMILHRDEWSKLCLDDIEYTIDGDESKDIKNYVAIEKPNYVLPEKPADYVEGEDDYVYTLTINKDIKDRFNFNVKFPRWGVESEGDNAYKFVDSWSLEREINIEPKMDGLVLYDWIDWDNDVPSISKDAKDEDIKKETWADLFGTTLWLGYREDEDSNPVNVSVDDISVLFDGEEAGEDKVEYHSNEKDEEFINFTFYALGDYTVSYTSEGGEESTIIINVVYPEWALYTTKTPSVDGLVRGDGSYGNEEIDDSRTFYFLNRGEDLEGEFEDLRAFIYEEDKTEIAIEKEEVTNGWKITINQGCRQDVQLKSYIQYEGEDEPREDEFCWLHYAGESEPHKNGSDGRDRAFSGCMYTEWGYQSNIGFWEDNCTPDNIGYWVHGDSVQDVLNKLASLNKVTVRNEAGESEEVSITPTGYYFIVMSCYTGDTDGGEANQKKTQTVTLSKDVKGVIMYSGMQEEVAWESSTPDFDEDGSVMVFTGFDDDKMACYLNLDEGESGWYEVTQADNGVYVYHMDLPVSTEIPEPYSPQWDDEELSAKYQTITKYYNWPDLALDATDSLAHVVLDGQWAEDAGVTIKYSNKKNSDFEVNVCGTKITKKDAEPDTSMNITVMQPKTDEDGNPLTDEDGNPLTDEIKMTTVSFSYVPCNHKDQTGEVKDAKKATCTAAGYTGDTYCTDCGTKTGTGKAIPATGHKWDAKDAKKATCTAAGYTGDTYCTDCGTKTGTGKAIPATGHKWDAGKVTKAATETEKGVKTYTCEVCKATKTEDIPVLEKKVENKGTKIEDEKGGDTYKVTSDSNAKEPTVEYTAPKKGSKATTVKVPDSVTANGVEYKVTAIADNAFKGNKQVKKVTISKNVTSIGKNAFSGCTKLTSVTVGSNVTKIGDSAFKGCSAMTKITLPAKVEKIGKNAFASCKKLKTITIKSTKLTAKNISKGAFKGVTTKTTIKVPKKKLNAYKKLFQQKGLSKKVKIKKA